MTAVLSGGGAVSTYTDNQYESSDLDFVTRVRMERLSAILEPLGFRRGPGRTLTHPECDYYLEFPPGPPAAGGLVFTEWHCLETPNGRIQILSPTQVVMDRLAAYIHWSDQPSLDQAVLVARRNEIDWKALEAWAEAEGGGEQYQTLVRRLGRLD